MVWVAKEDDRGFCLEGIFLTNWGVARELRKSRFMRSADDLNGLKSFIRHWPDGMQAVARVHPKSRAGCVRVTISYYNSKGRKFRKLPAAVG